MINEEVIIHSVEIKKLPEQKYFQVQLPADTKRIIGVETGAFRKMTGQNAFYSSIVYDPPDDPILPLFRINRNETIGRLTLHSSSLSKPFYHDEVRQQDTNWKYGDFTFDDPAFGQWSHDRKRYEVNVDMQDCSPVIECHYRDRWGMFWNCHVEYQLNIYIWIEKK